VTEGATSPETNIELLRATFHAFNAGDLGASMARLAPTFVINLAEQPEPLHGPETWRQGVEMMRQAFPDLQVDIEDIFGAQDRSPSGSGSAARTPANSWVSRPPGGQSATSAMSSTALPMVSLPRNGLLRHGHSLPAAGPPHRVTPIGATEPTCPSLHW
jgi:SnoaL-like polyketide cyclase